MVACEPNAFLSDTDVVFQQVMDEALMLVKLSFCTVICAILNF